MKRSARSSWPGIWLERLRRARWLTVFLLVVAVLAPYHQLLVGRAIPIPDDVFVSDLADGEFPPRVEAGRLVRAGEWPFWTSRIFSGFPMVPDPLSLVLFAALPPGLALGWLISVLLIMAAVGAYALARQLGASRSGAFLAAYAYSWSGVFVCQMRHLSELGTVAYFPLALFCLERAATGRTCGLPGSRALPLRRRLAWLVGFAALFGLQILSGFPQSAYISALVYAALVAARAVWLLARSQRGIPARERVAPAAGLALGALLAVTVGAIVGMAQLLPLRELGSLSDRGGTTSYEWVTYFNYWPPNFFTFFVPYANGDISNLTYRGGSIFWEDYGYVGLATVLLALLVGGRRARRFVSGRPADPDVDARANNNDFIVAFWLLTAVVAYGLVLGKATPLFRVAYESVPGLAMFRFPTRFLFVVELAITLLGGLGLTWVEGLIARHGTPPRLRSLPKLVGLLVVSLTIVDLVHFNRRQNPLADARRWLASPETASIIRASGEEGRAFAPGARQQHRVVFYESGGWIGDLHRYYTHRELLQPNANLLHGVDTLDGYAGISPRWTVDLIGDHNRPGLLNELYTLEPAGLRATPAFFDWLEALSVRWLIVQVPINSDRVEKLGASSFASVYRLRSTLPRARIVTRARIVSSMEEVRRLTIAGDLNLRQEVLLHDPAAAPLVASLERDAPNGGPAGDVRIVVDRATEVVIEANAPRGGLLLLADTFYPGWEATVDGWPTPILSANVAHRAVPLPPGMHHVDFFYRPQSVTRGLVLSGIGIAALTGAALLLWRRTRRAPARPLL